MAQLLNKPVTGLPALKPSRRTSVVAQAAVETKRQTASSSAPASGKAEEIYIGFPKGDYDRTPGRKGRVIKDNPSKYPNREDLGPFRGAVGGWAGGEVGLWELREQAQKEGSKKSSGGTQPLAPSSPIRAPQKNKWNVRTTSPVGKDEIYVGFGKDELELRKSGVQGRVIYDEAYKYPGKDDVGPFLGAVGGFAGGEAGLRNFVETGELKLRKPGDPAIKRQFSPLTAAFLIIFAAGGGAALLTGAIDIGELPQLGEIAQAPVIDDTTKNLLLASVALIGAAGTIVAVRTAVQFVESRMSTIVETTTNLAITSAFFGAVFLAARAILESP